MCLNYPETISLTPGLWIVLHETSPWGHKVGDCCPQRRNDDHQAPTQSVSSVTQPCPTLCYPMVAARQAFLSITNSQSLFKLMFMELVMPSSHLILCCPLLLLIESEILGDKRAFRLLSLIVSACSLQIRVPKSKSTSAHNQA